MGKNKKNLDNASGILGSDYESMQDIRSRLANTVLICVAVLGAPLVFISYLRYLRVGGLYIFATHLFVYSMCLIAVCYRRKIPARLKAFFLLACSLIIAVASIYKWGILGSGVSYFIFGSILATLFLGVRPGIIFSSLNIVVLIIAGLLYHTGHWSPGFNITEYSIALSSWINVISVYGCFTIVLVVCLGWLLNSMTGSIEKLENRTVELSEAKKQMEMEIKNREETEKAFQESEERFRVVLENLPVGVFVHDLEGKNLIVNDEACKSTGYSKEELLHRSVAETETDSFNMDEARKMWKHLIETGESVTLEFETGRKDGLVYDTEVHLKSIILQGRPVILAIDFDITERKKAEKALKESEERFRTVLENLPCAVVVHDMEGRLLIVNEEACLVKGYSREDLLGSTIMETAGPGLDPNYNVQALWEGIELGTSVNFEVLTQRKDGSLYDSEVSLTKLMLEGREVILSLVFDITERKNIEQSLARRSEFERLISEISSRFVGVSHYETDTYINEALASIGKLTGVDHAYIFLINPDGDVIGNINEWCIDETVPKIGSLKDVNPEKDMPWFSAELQSQGVVYIPDIDKLPPDARKEKIYFSAQRIKSLIVLVMRRGENLLGFLGFDNIYEKRTWLEDEIVILRIIGEAFTSAILRKQAEKEQEKLQAQLSTAVDLAHLGAWELDIENQIFTFNDQFYKIYHTTAEETGGYKISFKEYVARFVHPDDAPFLEEIMRKAVKPGAASADRFEYRMLYADGTTGYVMVQLIRVKNSKGIPVKSYGVNQDITEWKLAQKKLQENEEKLARSKKMESLGLLAGGVAHDLNNVLSGIVSYPELLLLDLPSDSKLRKPIETIQESGHRAVAIVQDLLTIARGAATVKEPLNLNQIINEYLSSPEFDKLKSNHPGVSFLTTLEKELFNFNGSPIHIKKVIMNLVSNAFEAIEEGGRVVISTGNRYIDLPVSRYEDVRTGEYVVLSVMDDGPGISKENLDRIFEPFFTKKIMGISGTGLGLTVVWNTVQDHSGYIDVRSDTNGTKFELYFPITRDESVKKDLPASMDELKGNGELILVVDDVDSQREISCRMLDTLGYRHVDVSSGEKAIEYLKGNKVDLVLLDMIMTPGISGRETYERIVRIHPGQRALIISGYSETEDVVAIQKLGAGGYVRKPFSLESLGRGIKGELAK